MNDIILRAITFCQDPALKIMLQINAADMLDQHGPAPAKGQTAHSVSQVS